MKRLLIIAFILAVSATAQAHPGKTDRYGGHKCLKDCEEWDLYYAEYHTHDKDGRPIRVSRKPTAANPVIEPEDTPAPLPESPRTGQTVTVYKYVTVVREESQPFNPLLLVLLVLLLLLLIYHLNGRKL